MLIMAALSNRAGHYIFALWFLLLLSCPCFYLFSSPILSRRRLDVYHTSTRCGLSANLGCRSETCCTRLAENTGCKKSRFGHHRTTLSGYVFVTKAFFDNRKKSLLSSSISSTCPHSMVNFGPLAAVLGTPGNFNGFRVLAVLLHGTSVSGVSQTLRC